jgi:hypothetical protein
MPSKTKERVHCFIARTFITFFIFELMWISKLWRITLFASNKEISNKNIAKNLQ